MGGGCKVWFCKHRGCGFTPFSSLVSQPGSSLEQTHIFVLAHILRRPIIVYGVKYYKSFRGETLGYTRFQGWCDTVPVSRDEPEWERSVSHSSHFWHNCSTDLLFITYQPSFFFLGFGIC